MSRWPSGVGVTAAARGCRGRTVPLSKKREAPQVFPLLAPGLVATSVYGFIQAWNEYLYALMVMSQQNQTVTVWLGNFTTKHGTEYAPMMAGSPMTAVPIVLLFLLVQRKMAAGLTAGAVKG